MAVPLRAFWSDRATRLIVRDHEAVQVQAMFVG